MHEHQCKKPSQHSFISAACGTALRPTTPPPIIDLIYVLAGYLLAFAASRAKKVSRAAAADMAAVMRDDKQFPHAC